MTEPLFDPYYSHQHHRLHQPNLYYYADKNLSYDDPKPLISLQIPKEQRHINTLFVSGLPDDIKPREIHNLFRRRPGFDFCQLKFTGRGNQVVAFVTFFNHHSAVTALQALDGVKFDPQAGSILHVELARSNSRRKRKPGIGPYFVIDKRRRPGDDDDETSSDDGDNEAGNPSKSRDPDSNNETHSGAKSGKKKSDPRDRASANEQREKTSEGDLQPCSTLFIANLGPNCIKDELKESLARYPGFNGVKLRSRGGMPVAFADYEEIEQATKAMEALQGSMLPSSDRGGMHIEYARSKMRKL